MSGPSGPPRPIKRLPKRPRPPPSELPSSASTEWVSVTASTDGKFAKKRRLERTEFDSKPVSPIPTPVRFPTPTIAGEEEDCASAPKGPSRVVLVWQRSMGDLHLNTNLLTGKTRRVDSILPTVSRRNPPTRGSSHTILGTGMRLLPRRAFVQLPRLLWGRLLLFFLYSPESSTASPPFHTGKFILIYYTTILTHYLRGRTGNSSNRPLSPHSDTSPNLATSLATRVHIPVPSVIS